MPASNSSGVPMAESSYRLPMAPREDRRASEARNASRSVAGTTRDGGSGSASRRRAGAAPCAAIAGGHAASPSAWRALPCRALLLTCVRGGGASPPALAPVPYRRPHWGLLLRSFAPQRVEPDEASRALRGVRTPGSGLWPSGLRPRHRLCRCGPIRFAKGEQRTTVPCGPFLPGIAYSDTRDKVISATHPSWPTSRHCREAI